MDGNNQETPEVKKNNGSALTSFIVSLVGLLIAGIPCGVVAIITGAAGMKSFNPETQKNKWMAIFGLVLGIIDIVVVSLVLPSLVSNL